MDNSKIKIGAVFPTCEIGNDPSVIRDWAQTAEGLGYDYILGYDHVLGAVHANRDPVLTGPYDEADPFHEPFMLFSYLAGLTKTIEFATGVLILPQRQTALVAKQATELALLSGNRLRLGVGTGWNDVEYESLGMPYGTRGKRFDEQIKVLRALWEKPVIDFSGDHHRIDRAGILPRPGERIPLWFGAVTPIPIKRATTYGDGVIFGTRPANLRTLLTKAQEHLDEAGRSQAEFGFEASLDFSLGKKAWREDLALWKQLGGTHVALRAMNTGNSHPIMRLETVDFGGPRGYIDALETFMNAIRG